VAVAVLGYASADRTFAVPALPDPDTTAIVRRLARQWPRLGGCGPQIAVELARRGIPVACLTWVGDDAVGRALVAELDDAGADTGGVVVAGARTAESYITYGADGRSVCFYDPGDAHRSGVSDAQRRAIADAAFVCLTVAPAAATRAALAEVRADARVLWSVKADPDAYPPDVVEALLERADAVVHAEGEAPFLRRQAPSWSPGPQTLVVETRGQRGVRWTWRGREAVVPVQPIGIADTTGAGDAFVAGLVAHLSVQPDDADGAVRAGVETSRALLVARGEEERP
jgi:sugar/nucleoside kinase (ribokinase family)